MGIVDIYSKRQKRARGEMPDVYVYEELPRHLRVQIIYIIRDAFNVFRNTREIELHWKCVNDILCREYGIFKLNNSRLYEDAVLEFFLEEEVIERAIDVLELCFKFINKLNSNNNYHANFKIKFEDAIIELNLRFKEHGVGYQFESNEIIRIDSDYLHAEAVKPALAILRGDIFKGANDEFLLAHEHYRHKRYKESLVDSLKAFESTMKAICKQRGWSVKPSDNAKNLIAICLNNGLIPSYLDSQFTSLRSLMESGIPTMRNKNGGHGQGTDVVLVPEYLARYALNLTASTILFLSDANEMNK